MKHDVMQMLTGKKPAKIPSKETLNHPGIIRKASGIDPFADTPTAYREAYRNLGIDIINRVPEENAPSPLEPGEVVDIGNGYKKSPLGLYDTVARDQFPFASVDEFFAADTLEPDYHALLTPVPHRLDAEEIRRKEQLIGEIGMYYYQLYTTFFMWGVEYLGWEVFMMAAALDPEQLKEKFLDVVFEKSLSLIRELCTVECPFIFCHDDLADKNGPVFQPQWYEEYIFPRYPELWKPIKEAGKKVIFVADGNMEQFIDPLLETGIDGVMFENPATDFDLILEKMEGKIVIGGVDTTMLTFGTPEEIKNHVRQVHEKTRGLPGFALSTPGGIHGNIPLQNLEAYFDIRSELSYTPENWRH
jgi:hypothetical protein